MVRVTTAVAPPTCLYDIAACLFAASNDKTVNIVTFLHQLLYHALWEPCHEAQHGHGSLRDRSKNDGSRVWGFRGVKARVNYEAQTDCD